MKKSYSLKNITAIIGFNLKTARNFTNGLLLVLVFGVVTNTAAQCGPYKIFESFKTATVPVNWSFSTGVTSFTVVTSTANARTGGYYLQQTGKNATVPAVYPSVVTEAIKNPKVISFYVKKSAAIGSVITYVLQYSPDGGTNWYTIPAGSNSVNGVSITATLPKLNSDVTLPGWSLVSANFKIRNPADS